MKSRKIFLILCCITSIFCFNNCNKEDDKVKNTSSNRLIPKNMASMPTARYSLGFVECDGLLYAIGGYNLNGLSTVEAYDPKTDTWQTKKAMPTPRGYLVVASVNHKIYAIGGFNGDPNNIIYSYSTEEYDPSSDTWTTKAELPINNHELSGGISKYYGNRFYSGSVMNNKIYVSIDDYDKQILCIYDPSTDQWERMNAPTIHTSLAYGIYQYTATNTNNNMYLINGAKFFKYNPDINEWNILPLPQYPKRGVALSSYNNEIYSFGGHNYDTIELKDIDIYNTTSSSWRKSIYLNTGRHSASAVYYDGYIYIVGGATHQKYSFYNDIPLSSLEAIKVN